MVIIMHSPNSLILLAHYSFIIFVSQKLYELERELMYEFQISTKNSKGDFGKRHGVAIITMLELFVTRIHIQVSFFLQINLS